MLHQISEHMEVVGSDGMRVGQVDKLEGDRIKLTRDSDPHGQGHHHYLPVSAVQSTQDGKVMLQMSGSEAKRQLTAQMG